MSLRCGILLEWCNNHNITLPNIELVDHDLDNSSVDTFGISVVARSDLTYSDIVAKIPKSTVLSRRTSQLLTKTPPDINTTGDDTMELALILAYEMAIGERSTWHGYLQSLPREQVPVAALWEGNEDEDSQFALLWLQGTETERATYSPGTGSSISKNVFNYFHQMASPSLAALGYETTISEFQRAWSLVSSRSFRVDAYHGLAMVPIADA
ncbi:hypothetical protein FRC09_018898, partial [Ceratobasidium sp. 395]